MKDMVLKDDIISNQSHPLLLSVSQHYSMMIVYSLSLTRKDTGGRANLVNLHHCECVLRFSTFHIQVKRQCMHFLHEKCTQSTGTTSL